MSKLAGVDSCAESGACCWCRSSQAGEADIPGTELKERGEMFRILVHHLLVHGEGLSLGPDCDGLLNQMVSDELPADEHAENDRVGIPFRPVPASHQEIASCICVAREEPLCLSGMIQHCPDQLCKT